MAPAALPTRNCCATDAASSINENGSEEECTPTSRCRYLRAYRQADALNYQLLKDKFAHVCSTSADTKVLRAELQVQRELVDDLTVQLAAKDAKYHRASVRLVKACDAKLLAAEQRFRKQLLSMNAVLAAQTAQAKLFSLQTRQRASFNDFKSSDKNRLELMLTKLELAATARALRAKQAEVAFIRQKHIK